MYTEKFVSFFQSYKKIFILGAFFVIIFFILGDGVFANTNPYGTSPYAGEGSRGGGGGSTILDEDTAKKAAEILNFLLAGAAIILSMITSFITIFLYPGWVNGSLFGLQDYFKDIWILISNVVYFIFAGVLIVLAFMNIIGKGEGNWELKQALPKFIVGVLIVPFSWFFVQFILSITSILTVGVLTLPYDTFKDRPELESILSNEVKSQEFCKDFIIDLEGNGGGRALGSLNGVGGSGENNIEFPETLKCANGTDSTTTFERILTGNGKDGVSNSVFGIINIYTYGILQIDKLDTISTENITGAIKDISDLLFKIIFDALFVVVYLLLMIALFLALFVRIVRLWIYMMLSPAFGLLYFFGKSSEGVGSDNAKFSIKEFVSLALVPVYVSAALAFGLVFILVAGSGIEKGQEESKNTLEAGGFSITIIGAFAETSEKSVIGKLIVKIFGLVILWLAVMAALRSSETTRAVVEPIAAFGKSVGELAAKAPTYAPIIPTGGPGSQRLSAAGLQTFGSNVAGTMDQNARQRGSDFAGKVTNAGEVSREYQRLANTAVKTADDSAKAVQDILKIGESKDIANNTSAIDGLSKHLEKMAENTKYFSASKKEAVLGEIEKLKTAKGDPIKVRAILAEIDKIGESGNTILGGDRVVAAASVDQFLGKDAQSGPSGSGNKDQYEIKPTVRDEVEGGKVVRQKIEIDRDTTVYVKDGEMDDEITNSTERFLTHLNSMGGDEDGKKIMKKNELRRILSKMGIIEKPQQDRIINKIDDEFFVNGEE